MLVSKLPADLRLVKPTVGIGVVPEQLPARFFEAAQSDLPRCELLLVLGTSLQVHPFAGLVGLVPPSCPRVLINRERVNDEGVRVRPRVRLRLAAAAPRRVPPGRLRRLGGGHT